MTGERCFLFTLTKHFLEKHKIAYKEIDIESVPGAAEEVVRLTGKCAIPQFVINGNWVQPYRGEGFSTKK
ncbi:MAG: glutaredoxin family protein [Terriglobia bacterium]|nr:glutaredoxin family protein [Terriglobia bacterium]